MNTRELMGIKAKHIAEHQEARAEALKEARQVAQLLGYKHITWKVLAKLGYDITKLGYRG